MKLVFVGWYDRDNSGDEAFKDVHKRLFPDAEIVWANDSTDLQSFNQDWIFILGGGDVLLPFYIDKIPAERKFFVYGVGLGGVEQRNYAITLRDRILGMWLRNESDVFALQRAGFACSFTPDMVFQLRDQVERAPIEHPSEGGLSKNLIVFPSNNLVTNALASGDMLQYHYLEYMQHALARILSELQEFYNITIIPLSRDRNDDDIIWALRMYSIMKRKSNVYVHQRDLLPLDVMGLVKSAQLVVSMKYHGLVYAIMSKVPCINIGLSRKTGALLSENGLSDVAIEPYSFHPDHLRRAVKVAEGEDFGRRIAAVSDKVVEVAHAEGRRFSQAVRDVSASMAQRNPK